MSLQNLRGRGGRGGKDGREAFATVFFRQRRRTLVLLLLINSSIFQLPVLHQQPLRRLLCNEVLAGRQVELSLNVPPLGLRRPQPRQAIVEVLLVLQRLLLPCGLHRRADGDIA